MMSYNLQMKQRCCTNGNFTDFIHAFAIYSIYNRNFGENLNGTQHAQGYDNSNLKTLYMYKDTG